MIRKLFRTGNSLALSVPQAAADALGVAEGDFVHLEHDAAAGALVVWPLAAHQRLALGSAYVRTVADFLRDYGDALAALDAD
jgi:antitoxin component of MazEF toxin-antitoxin module